MLVWVEHETRTDIATHIPLILGNRAHPPSSVPSLSLFAIYTAQPSGKRELNVADPARPILIRDGIFTQNPYF